MITDAIITAFFGSINALLSLMPSYVLPTELVVDRTLIIGQYASLSNNIFPLVTIAKIAGLALAIKLLMFGWDFIVYIYHQFWGSS